MKILSVKDRISIKYKNPESDEFVEFIIRPLTVSQKMEVASKTKIVKGEEVADFQKQAFLCLKYSICDVIGLKDYQGNDYKVSVTHDGLDDESTDDLVEFMSQNNLLANTYYAANKMLDKIEGVEVTILPKN